MGKRRPGQARGSRWATTAATLALAWALAAPVLGASAAWATEQSTHAGAQSPLTTPKSAIAHGVCAALDQLQRGIDARGREIHDEQALEHARRTDAVAEQLRLQALNNKGEAYGAAVEAEAAEAREAQREAERAAAEAASSVNRSAIVNEAVPTAPAPLTSTIYFHGQYIPFVQGNPADVTAPKSKVASTWIGGGDVDDGLNTYFIGHNPGVFSGVMNLQIGDEIVVWDESGASRSYFVFDALVLPNASNYFAYESRLSPSGESITLQTCVADDRNVRCVMAR